MNRSLAFMITLALASAAFAQEAARIEPKSEPKKPPPLNLRLDDGNSAAPRITFEQQPSAQTKQEREKGLPDLGGKPSHAFDRPTSSSSGSGSVVPKAYDPVLNQ